MRAAIQIVARAIALMSGAFSLICTIWFAFLASHDRAPSPSNAVLVYYYLFVGAFIISGGVAWFTEHRKVLELEALPKQPIFVARRTIFALKMKAEKMKAGVLRKWFAISDERVQNLNQRFVDTLETFMSPNERLELLGRRADFAAAVEERMQLIMDHVADSKIDLVQKLNDLLYKMDVAVQRIDRIQ